MKTKIDSEGNVIAMLPTAERVLGRQELRGVSIPTRYCAVRIGAAARVQRECGAPALVAYLAVVATHDTLPASKKSGWFKIRQTIQDATDLPRDRFSRAVRALEAAGYVERDQRPGRKPLLRLTDKGRMGLVAGKGSRFK